MLELFLYATWKTKKMKSDVKIKKKLYLCIFENKMKFNA